MFHSTRRADRLVHHVLITSIIAGVTVIAFESTTIQFDDVMVCPSFTAAYTYVRQSASHGISVAEADSEGVCVRTTYTIDEHELLPAPREVYSYPFGAPSALGRPARMRILETPSGAFLVVEDSRVTSDL